MTPFTTQAVTRAIEGGFRPLGGTVFTVEYHAPTEKFRPIVDGDSDYGGFSIEEFLMNPAFWQALWKHEGWPKQVWSYGKKFIPADKVESSLYHQHRLIDWLAEGKDIESFFKDILTAKETK